MILYEFEKTLVDTKSAVLPARESIHQDQEKTDLGVYSPAQVKPHFLYTPRLVDSGFLSKSDFCELIILGTLGYFLNLAGVGALFVLQHEWARFL